jgi:hypothetical protein
MAEEEVPEVVDDLRKRADEQDSELPEGVDVPLRGSEDEAMRAVQQQFKDAGTECTDDEARKLVHAAWEKYGKKDESDENSDKSSDETSDETSNEKSDKSSDEKSDG